MATGFEFAGGSWFGVVMRFLTLFAIILACEYNVCESYFGKLLTRVNLSRFIAKRFDLSMFYEVWML